MLPAVRGRAEGHRSRSKGPLLQGEQSGLFKFQIILFLLYYLATSQYTMSFGWCFVRASKLIWFTILKESDTEQSNRSRKLADPLLIVASTSGSCFCCTSTRSCRRCAARSRPEDSSDRRRSAADRSRRFDADFAKHWPTPVLHFSFWAMTILKHKDLRIHIEGELGEIKWQSIYC